MPDAEKLKIMIAGIGGASLGTELLKCLILAGRYEVFGCDISPTAYGLYDSSFSRTSVVSRSHYVRSVIEACRKDGVGWLIPGGEQSLVLLGAAAHELVESGITLVANDAEVIRTFSDKAMTFEALAGLGIPVPKTIEARVASDIEQVGLPCIIKPATGTGGSASVFFATDIEEGLVYVDYITRSGGRALAQEYIDHNEGEFTVGVLSLPNGEVLGSVALRRSLEAKLSVISRGRGGVISSGYSQGYIGDFATIRGKAEAIASAVGSRGPLNIQGRVREGELIPFEINPRFSASTYLRAMAGCNEVDILLQFLAHNTRIDPGPLREGWYLRSLTEQFVPSREIKS